MVYHDPKFLKEKSTLKHMNYVYNEIFEMMLVMLVLICLLVLYCHYFCEKLAAMCHSDVTAGRLLLVLHFHCVEKNSTTVFSHSPFSAKLFKVLSEIQCRSSFGIVANAELPECNAVVL